MHFKLLYFAVFALLAVTLVDATPLSSRANKQASKNNKKAATANSNNNAAANNNNAAANNNNANLAATLTSSASNAARTRPCDQGDQSLAAALQANVVVGLGQQASIVTLQAISADQAAAAQLADSVSGNSAVQRRAVASKSSKSSSSQAQAQNSGANANANSASNASSNNVNSNANSNNANSNSSNVNSNDNSSNSSSNNNNNGDNSNNSNNSDSSNSTSDFQDNLNRLNQFMQTSALLIQAAQEIADDGSFAQPQLQILADQSSQTQLISQLTGDASTDAQTLNELFASFVQFTGLSQDGVDNALIDCFLPLTTISG